MRIKVGNVLLIILVMIGIVAASVGGYFWWQKRISLNSGLVQKDVSCQSNSDCFATCSKGCVDKTWWLNAKQGDCEAIPNFDCKCNNGTCQKIEKPQPTETSEKSGIYGVATVGPTCPGPQRLGQICNKGYVGTVVIMKTGSQNDDPVSLEEFTRFQTDQDGNFRVNLPPGDYIAFPFPKNSVTFSKTQIHVDQGKFSKIDIVFDTGIR